MVMYRYNPSYFSTNFPCCMGFPTRMLRMCLMIYLVEVMGGAWLVEQPSQSLLRFHPRVMWTFSIFRAARLYSAVGVGHYDKRKLKFWSYWNSWFSSGFDILLFIVGRSWLYKWMHRFNCGERTNIHIIDPVLPHISLILKFCMCVYIYIWN